MKTTGKVTPKLYKCTNCGHEQLQSTNHWGEIYPACPECQWKRPMEMGSVWKCLEPMPEGYQKPEPWKMVKLGDICKIETIPIKNLLCPNCKKPVTKDTTESVNKYPYECSYCDESFYKFELKLK